MNKREFKDNKKSYGNRGSRSSRKFSGSGYDRRAARRKFDDDRESPRRRFNDDDESPRRRFKDENEERPRRRFNSENEERPRRKFNSDSEDRPRRRFNRDNDGDFKDKGFGRRKFDGDRPKRRFDGERSDDGRPRRRFEGALSDEERLQKKLERRRRFNADEDDKRPRRRDVTAESEILTEIVARRKAEGRQSKPKQKVLSLEQEEQHGPIRLNKYIANAGKNIKVVEFARLEKGEGIQKKEDDFAAEVASMVK